MIRAYDASSDDALDALFAQHDFCILREPGDEDVKYYVFEEEEKILGGIAISSVDGHEMNELAGKQIIDPETQACIVSALAVDKDHGGKGIGQSLLEKMIKSTCPCKSIWLATRKAEQDFYERFGFRLVEGVILNELLVMTLMR